jgi:glycosyltransferase involved in cell wall biosynthesis
MLHVEVTQFARQPARSGVQRALAELARAWPVEVPARFVVRDGSRFRAVPPHVFASVVDDVFASSPRPDDRERVHDALRGEAIPAAEVAAEPLLLPEPTYDAEVLADLEDRVSLRRPVTAVVHDLLPMTHPWAFPGNGQVVPSRYFRLLGGVSTAVATSVEVHDDLVRRLRRSAAGTRTAWLGVDHLPAREPGRPEPGRFLVLGTVEPRKRFPLVAAAVRALRGRGVDTELVIVGRAGCEEPRELARLALGGNGVRWASDASDEEVASEVSRASALVSVGDEGFGLPVVEAARSGVPVVYDGKQPAARLLDGRGAWRVDASSPESLAAALLPWCDPAHVTARRAEIDLVGLPTWSGFSRDVAEWAAV